MSLDYAIVFEHVPVAMCVSNQRTVELCNPAALGLFGYTTRAFTGMPISLLWPSLIRQKSFPEKIFGAIANSGSYTGVRSLKLADGKFIWCRINVTLYDRSCDALRYIWTFVKVETTLKMVEELSPREQQIAIALVVGKTSKAIAQDVGLSIRTIEYYRERLMRRLGVANYKELISRMTIGVSR